MSALARSTLVELAAKAHGLSMSSTPSSELTWTRISSINHEKAWHVLCRLEPAELLVLFSRALRFVPPENLGAVFRDHAQPHELGELPAND
jgi:hypothetical protein